MKKALSVMLAAAFLSACIQSETKSFTDPDYIEAKFTKLIVNLNALPPTTRIEAEKVVLPKLREAGLDAVMLSDVVPPTRSFTPEEAIEIIAQSGHEYMLTVRVLDSISSVSPATYYSYSYGSGTVNGNRVKANATTTSIPIIHSKGSTAMLLMIFDVKSGNTAWEASVLTKSSGTHYVGNEEEIARSAIGSIIEKLKTENHI